MSADRGRHERLMAARSDVRALESLYRELAPEILGWLRVRVSEAEVARDLLAETFAQVIVSVDRYRGDSDAAATAWTWAIARNLLRHFYRHQQVEARARRRLEVVETVHADTPGPADVGVRLHAALDELPAGTRESVWLRLVDELSYDEIASRQGCSESAARKRVSRGMRTLAIVLEDMR